LEEKGYNTAFIYKRNFEIHIALGSFKEVDCLIGGFNQFFEGKRNHRGYDEDDRIKEDTERDIG